MKESAETGIGAAIASVMAGVVGIAKTRDNKFEGFKYASVDDLFEMLRPLMAANGLFVVCTVRGDVTEVGPYIMAPFDIALHHSGGEQIGPVRTYALAPIKKGAFVFGMMQSYAVKYFLRQIFMVPLGEEEIDGLKGESAPFLQRAPVIRSRNDEQKSENLSPEQVSAALEAAETEYLEVAGRAGDAGDADLLGKLRDARHKRSAALRFARDQDPVAFIDAETAFLHAAAMIIDEYSGRVSDGVIEDIGKQIRLISTIADVAMAAAKAHGDENYMVAVASAADLIITSLRDARIAVAGTEKLASVAAEAPKQDAGSAKKKGKKGE